MFKAGSCFESGELLLLSKLWLVLSKVLWMSNLSFVSCSAFCFSAPFESVVSGLNLHCENYSLFYHSAVCSIMFITILPTLVLQVNVMRTSC